MANGDGELLVRNYKDNPEGYVKDILKVRVIEKWQSKLLGDVAKACKDRTLSRRFAVRSGHGVGKTAVMAWLNKWFMSTRPDPQIVVTANTESQLSTKTWRELSIWNDKALDGAFFDHTATKFAMKGAEKTWFASAIPWTEHRSEAFAGTHAKSVMYQFDEASAIVPIIWEVSEGAMTTEDCWWFVFGNPTMNTGKFAECWGKYRHRWNLYEVDSREVSIADQDQIKRWIEDEGEDSDFVRVRVRGLPPRSSMLEFIGVEDYERCIKFKAEGYSSFPIILGIDVARFGDDKNVIYKRQGRKSEYIDSWSGVDGMQSASRIIKKIMEINPDVTFIDEGGVGGPILDRVRAIIGASVIGVNFGAKADDDLKWFNKRAEMWGDLRESMRQGLEIEDNSNLRSDLLGPLYFFSPKEQIKLERKEDMKKRGLASPDFADALALTFAQKVVKREAVDALEFSFPEVESGFGL